MIKGIERDTKRPQNWPADKTRKGAGWNRLKIFNAAFFYWSVVLFISEWWAGLQYMVQFWWKLSSLTHFEQIDHSCSMDHIVFGLCFSTVNMTERTILIAFFTPSTPRSKCLFAIFDIQWHVYGTNLWHLLLLQWIELTSLRWIQYGSSLS